MLYKIIALVLAISTVFASVCSAINIIFRVPDFFRFEFDRVEVSDKLDLGISGTDLGSLFSRYMLHKNETFSLVSEYEGIEREIFNGDEAAMMDNFRVLLDVLLIVAIVTLVLTIACIVILYIKMHARSLRVALNISLGIYIVLMTGLVLYFNVYDGETVLMNGMMEGAEFGSDDLLQQMFDGRFTLDTTVTVGVISFIIMMIIRYIIWRMTAQKGMFSEGLKGVAK